MKTTTKQRLYRSIFFTAAALCVFEALGEWFFLIPFQHYYFPNQHDRFEFLRVVLFFVLALLCLGEGSLLYIYRRFSHVD